MVERRVLVTAAVALVAAVAAIVLVALVLRSGPAERTGETKREAAVRPTVRATLSPATHRFGERVTARIELIVRKAELEPDTARPGSTFEPYRVLGPPRRKLEDFGALWHADFTVTLQCLRQACLPEGQSREFDFGNAGVTFKTPPPPGRRFQDRRLDQRSASGAWPSLKVASWLSPEDVESARWRSSLGDLPPATFRIAPRWLVALLLGAAVALVLAAAALAAGEVRERLERRVREEAEAAEPPLAQALALVEESRLNGDAQGRRVALETLAYELRAEGHRVLAADAERLAWSPAPPQDASLATLVADVRNSVDGDPA